ncbi:hypothetical protein [Priestia megaterium]|uniref:hypothetical protein n=1 Tax=Priestia megaterium TaxID=1404 RepID=UPI0016498426|nr:hypothetical protein [Priestia megaterium]
MQVKESYYRSVLRHFLKNPNEHLKNMNDYDCEEEYERISSNTAWSENLYM